MSTRSAIIVKSGDSFKGIYCHFDGYPSHVGRILRDHYNSQEMANALMDLGDISCLYPNISGSPNHSFGNREKDVTVAYMRDRGEEGCEAIAGSTSDELAGKIGHNGHVYVFENGMWTHNGGDIDEAIAKDL